MASSASVFSSTTTDASCRTDAPRREKHERAVVWQMRQQPWEKTEKRKKEKKTPQKRYSSLSFIHIASIIIRGIKRHLCGPTLLVHEFARQPALSEQTDCLGNAGIRHFVSSPAEIRKVIITVPDVHTSIRFASWAWILSILEWTHAPAAGSWPLGGHFPLC
jgi:hypothetical protein